MKMRRTHNCGILTAKDAGKSVILSGWVARRRDHGGVLFVDLRDREGITQVVFNPEANPALHKEADKLRSEFVVTVSGAVSKRPEGTKNIKLKTGEIEVFAEQLEILNLAETPPFEIEDNALISDDVRFAYRYLDLRRPSMQKNLILRHKISKLFRDTLDAKGFVEVETPILTKSTPEGARDYLVPSRVNPGKFFALPQSPQLFKQILMVAGLEKYFQIAKCFRDEDLRADRQPEFTQLDIEMSFVDEEDIYRLCEELMQKVFRETAGVELGIPFPRLAHKEAMARYGIDKPDTRFTMELVNCTEDFRTCEFKIFRSAIEAGNKVIGINAKGGDKFSIKEMDDLTQVAKSFGAAGLAHFRVKENGLSSPISKFFKADFLSALSKKMDGETGDLLLFIAERSELALAIMGSMRNYLAKDLGLAKPLFGQFNFLWVVDFPLLKYNEEEKRWESEHHPFTSPKEEDIPLLGSHPERARARAYDLVVNGIEIASGSIRIHRRDLQEKLFKIIGISECEAQERFGFLLEAFKYGAPPHAGIAFGLDRFITLFIGEGVSIRDVIPFPKTQRAVCPLTGAPSSVDAKQLKELGLSIKK